MKVLRLIYITAITVATVAAVFVVNCESPLTTSDEKEPPANLRAVYTGFEIIVNWAPPKSGEALGYELYRSYDGDSYSNIARLNDDQLVYVDNGIGFGNTYFYKIRAIYSGKFSAYSNPCEVNASYSITGKYTGNEVQLVWTEMPPAWVTGYKILRGETSDQLEEIAEVGSESNEYEDTSAEIGKTYFYAFSPYRDGENGPTSPECKVLTILILGRAGYNSNIKVFTVPEFEEVEDTGLSGMELGYGDGSLWLLKDGKIERYDADTYGYVNGFDIPITDPEGLAWTDGDKLYVSSNADDGAYLYAIDAESGVIITYWFFEDFYDSGSYTSPYGHYGTGWSEERNYRFFDLTARDSQRYAICHAWGHDWWWRWPDPHGYYSYGDSWDDYRIVWVHENGYVSSPKYSTDDYTIDCIGYFDGYFWFQENSKLYKVSFSEGTPELVAEQANFAFFELNDDQ